MYHGAWLKDFIVFLVAAGLIVPLFHRARIGAVLGFLLIGLFVGPFGLGRFAADHPWIEYVTIADRERVALFAELGIMFLLFMVGLELSPARLWSMRRLLLGVGGTQFVLSAVLIGCAVALTGVGPAPAIVLGLCLAMSSTAIVMQLLEEQGRTTTPVGRLAIAVLMFQDVMVAPVLVATEMLGREGQSIVAGLGGALLQAAVALVVLGGAGTLLLRPLFNIAGRTGSRELMIAMTLLIVVTMAAVTGQFGLSAGLGAFLAGVLLSDTEYRHHIEVDIAPVKGLLLGMFFISVGMTIDVWAAAAAIGPILIGVAGLFLLKAAALFAACRLFAVARPVAAEAAVLLGQGGEFAFVAIAIAGQNGVLPPPLAQFATVVVGLGMMLTPFAALLARRLGQRVERKQAAGDVPSPQEAELADHVVIGGFGRVGQIIGRLLDAEHVPFVAVDVDAKLVAEQRKLGRNVYFGDAGRPELLDRIGAGRACAFVATVNDPRAAEHMLRAARDRSDAPLFARAKDVDHALRLLKLGPVHVIPEALEASLQLGARVLEAIGLPDEAVAQRLESARAEELGRLDQPKN
jgi:monovalent cation:H+ antiporter-2, CPA2 family